MAAEMVAILDDVTYPNIAATYNSHITGFRQKVKSFRNIVTQQKTRGGGGGGGGEIKNPL